MLILVINPGSTSTKLAIYEDERELLKKSISHPTEKLREFSKPSEQREFRAQVVKEFLDEAMRPKSWTVSWHAARAGFRRSTAVRM